MKPPCDEAAIGSRAAASPCADAVGRWVLAATILASSMAFIDSTVVNVALPALQTSFGANVVDVQWVIEAYGLTLAALILVGGSMGDLFGRRRMFLWGSDYSPRASAFCGLAASIQQLILARAVQGMGAAFLVPGSLALISASFGEGKTRPRHRHLVGIDRDHHCDWPGDRRLADPALVVAMGFLPQCAAGGRGDRDLRLWRVPESRSREQERIDGWGALTATLSLAGLVYGFLESASSGLERSVCRGQPRRRRSLPGRVSCLSKPDRSGRWCR